MTDEPDNLVLTCLRRIDAKVDRLAEDMRHVNVGLTGVEEAVVGLHRRLDRLELPVERIERRLDIVDMPH